MIRWLKDFLEKNPEYHEHRIVKRTKRSVHFEIAPGLIEAHILAEPMRRLKTKTDLLLPWWIRWSPFATTTENMLDSTGDGHILGSSTTYATANSTSSSFDTTSTTFNVGQQKSGSTYNIWRGFLKFDTSHVGPSGTVSQVNLKMVCTTDNSATDFNVDIVKQDWSAQDPIAAGNRETAYDNCLSGTLDGGTPWRNTSGMSAGTQYASPNLDTAWVNATGNTYYSLRSDRDKAGTAPTANEYIVLGSANNATVGSRPVLTVIYSIPHQVTAEYTEAEITPPHDVTALYTEVEITPPHDVTALYTMAEVYRPWQFRQKKQIRLLQSTTRGSFW